DEIGLADHTIGVKDIHQQILDVAAGTIQIRNDVVASTLELMTLGALRFENFSAALERAAPFMERKPHPVDQCVQIGGRVANFAPDRLDLLVELGIVKGANPQDGIVRQVISWNLFVSHGGK